MKEFGRAVLALVVIAALISIFWLFMLPLFAGGRVVDRAVRKYDTESERQAYETSRAYNDGMAVDLDNLCREWRINPDANAKAVLADTLRLRAARYDTGKLPGNVQRCLEEVQ